jgi:hypothetical protein
LPQARSTLSIFTNSVSQWGPTGRRIAVLCALLVTGAFAIVIGMKLGNSFRLSDVGWYLRLSYGDPGHKVMQPFASRQLGPAMVRLFAWILHWPQAKVFVWQGMISLLVTLIVMYGLALRTFMPRWMLTAMALVPFWPQLYLGLVLPDLWYTALLSVLLVLLLRKHFLLAALIMFPLMVSRESTSLTLVCFLIAGWHHLRWRDRLLAIGSALAGSLLVQRLTALSPGNREHLPESVYILSKAPWNFTRNILGIQPWSNVYPQLCRVPVWQHSLQAGPVHAIGVCGFNILLPCTVLATALSTFGLLPLLTAFFWWRTRHTGDRSFLQSFCLVYGAACFIIAPLLGVSMAHLFGYSWTFSLVALPMLFGDMATRYPSLLTSKRAASGLGILGMHLAACGLAFAGPSALVDVALIAIYLFGFSLLRWWFSPAVQEDFNPLQDNPQQAATGA